MKVVRCSWSLPNGNRESLNGPHIKILEKEKKKKEKKKKAQQRNIANGANKRCGARFPWTWTFEVPMDVRAGLTCGSYGWRTRDLWMTH